MEFVRTLAIAALITAFVPGMAAAQDRKWAVDLAAGAAAFIDESVELYAAPGVTLRRQVTPRISVGPELAVMINAGVSRDLNVMLTGNVVFDLFAQDEPDARTFTPFLVGGVGMFWGRDDVFNGPVWFSDPAFTVGGGVRGKLTEAVSVGAEYRLGWELHQRVNALVSVRW